MNEQKIRVRVQHMNNVQLIDVLSKLDLIEETSGLRLKHPVWRNLCENKIVRCLMSKVKKREMS